MRIAVHAFDGVTMFHLSIPQMVFGTVSRLGLANWRVSLFTTDLEPAPSTGDSTDSACTDRTDPAQPSDPATPAASPPSDPRTVGESAAKPTTTPSSTAANTCGEASGGALMACLHAGTNALGLIRARTAASRALPPAIVREARMFRAWMSPIGAASAEVAGRTNT